MKTIPWIAAFLFLGIGIFVGRFSGSTSPTPSEDEKTLQNPSGSQAQTKLCKPSIQYIFLNQDGEQVDPGSFAQSPLTPNIKPQNGVSRRLAQNTDRRQAPKTVSDKHTHEAENSAPDEVSVDDENEAEEKEETPEEKARGDRIQAALHDVIKASVKPIKSCYDLSLSANPELAGKIIVELSIKSKNGVGHLIGVKIKDESTLIDPEMLGCFIKEQSKVVYDFSEVEDGKTLTVEVPFLFKKQED